MKYIDLKESCHVCRKLCDVSLNRMLSPWQGHRKEHVKHHQKHVNHGLHIQAYDHVYIYMQLVCIYCIYPGYQSINFSPSLPLPPRYLIIFLSYNHHAIPISSRHERETVGQCIPGKERKRKTPVIMQVYRDALREPRCKEKKGR